MAQREPPAMTKEEEAIASSVIDGNDSVEKILTRRFGESVSFKRAERILVHFINRSRSEGRLVLSGATKVSIDPAYAQFLDALAVIVEVGPVLIAGSSEVLQEAQYRGYSLSRDVLELANGILDLRSFVASAKKLSKSKLTSLFKNSDPRSNWHKTAKFFAKLIEDDFRAANTSAPTRNSRSSPLVIAVSELLELAGSHRDDEAVRKALVGKK